MEATFTLERQRARAVAQEYLSKGYEVIEEPAPDQLPDFLSDYRPDLLIRRGNEVTIVEVKSKSSLSKYPQVRDLARLLQGKPGWNFELILVAEGENLNVPEGVHPFEREDVVRGIEAAEALLKAGFPEAALLLAWSTVEATVRLLAEEEGIPLDRLSPPYILKQVVTEGLISKDDYNFLLDAIKYRNALVHGFKVTYFDSALVRNLISTVKSILELTTKS